MDCREYNEMIAGHVDGTLAPEENQAVQTHLNQCPKCRQRFLWETEAKKFLKQKLTSVSARPGLQGKILDRLEEASGGGLLRWSYWPYRLAAACAFMIILAVPYLVWRGGVQEEIFSDTIIQYQKVAQGIVEAPEKASLATPPARLLDLSPWGYRLLVKQTHQVKGQKWRVFVYQGQENEYLLAQELDGGDILTPPGAVAIRASNRDFVSYTQEGVNLIAWKEKDLVCILASALPREKLLGLAQKITTGS